MKEKRNKKSRYPCIINSRIDLENYIYMKNFISKYEDRKITDSDMVRLIINHWITEHKEGKIKDEEILESLNE